ncbi:MAG TPA: protein kinase [Elusimicrobiota bacterium]|nr:protein kinase [Elusimicrobiota bacterium]
MPPRALLGSLLALCLIVQAAPCLAGDQATDALLNNTGENALVKAAQGDSSGLHPSSDKGADAGKGQSAAPEPERSVVPASGRSGATLGSASAAATATPAAAALSDAGLPAPGLQGSSPAATASAAGGAQGSAAQAAPIGDPARALADARREAALNPGDRAAQARVSELEDLARAKDRVAAARLDFGAPRAAPVGRGGAAVALPLKGGLVVPGAELRIPAPGVVPPNVLTLFRQAHDKLAAGDDDGALLALREAVDLDPTRADAWETMSEILNKEGDYAGAVAAAEKALAIDPSDARALRAKSYAEFNLGKYQDAFTDANRAVALDPANGLGYLYRAMAEEKLGMKDQAIKDYRLAEKFDPALTPAAEEGLLRLLGGSAPNAATGFPSPLVRRVGVVGGSGLLILLGLLGTASGRRAVQDYTRRLKTVVGPKPAEEPRGAAGASEAETVSLGALIGGHYRVTGELGRGGMGAVYKAQDETLQRPVAIKRLLRERREGGDELERLLKEARLVAQLRHPNIAEIYSVITDRDPMLVFEFVDGESLDKTLRRSAKLSPSRAREVVAQVCSALEYAHGRRIIHRDLKPANVMFAADRSVKVMDFGIAHQSTGGGADTRTMTAAGTPQYMAPEQGMGSVSKASDLYALGAMAYELLTGSRPFDGPDFLEPKLRKEFLPAAKVNPSLPAAVDAFFAAALEPDPLKRPASALEFRKAFDAALGGVTTEA